MDEIEEYKRKLIKAETEINELRIAWKEIDTRMNVIYRMYDELDEKLRRVKEEL